MEIKYSFDKIPISDQIIELYYNAGLFRNVSLLPNIFITTAFNTNHTCWS